MFIQHDLKSPPRCWRLDVNRRRQTIVFASWGSRLPEIVYCGSHLPADENLVTLAQSRARPLTPGTMDQVAHLSLLPEHGMGFPGQPGLVLVDSQGRPALTQFRLTDVISTPRGFEVECHDAPNQISIKFHLSCPPDSAVLETSTELTNTGTTDWFASWLSAPVLPVSEEMNEVLEFSGRWTQEFNPVRVPISRGIHMRENRRGRTGFDHFPAMIFATPGTGFTSGTASAVHFAFSGLHKMFVEELPDGRRQLQAGCPEDRSLRVGQTISSGTAFWSFSDRGLNGIAHDFQEHVRTHVVRFPEPRRPRPVHYNTWEAVYFDHDVEVLEDLANRAAAVGAERFVLDDGWFATGEFARNDDKAGLGDWYVDPDKYPHGLTPLVEHVRSLGMHFGIWIEPEMVNLRSQLAVTHPKWVMMHAHVPQIAGRDQQVLDLTNTEVTDYLFERLDWLLGNHAIDYVKWDMNRDLTLAVDAGGFPLLVRQTRALLKLIDRIRAAHPEVEIETCASGGGRIDYEILERTHRVWLSDSHDSHERWQAQNQAFLFLPPEITASHVGADRCHTSGRRLSMAFRAQVAMTGHMGIEADLRELDDAELATLAHYTSLFKANREWMHQGLQYRLDHPSPDCIAQLHVSKGGERFMLFSGTLDVPTTETTPPLRLTGLDGDAHYRVKLLNTEDIEEMANRSFVSPFLEPDGLTLSGAALMHAGLVPPFPFPDSMWLFEGTRVSS